MKEKLQSSILQPRVSLGERVSIQFREDVQQGITRIQQATGKSRQGVVNELLSAALFEAERIGVI